MIGAIFIASALLAEGAWSVTPFHHATPDAIEVKQSDDAISMTMRTDPPEGAPPKRIYSVHRKIAQADPNGEYKLIFEARQTTRKQQYILGCVSASPGRCPPETGSAVWPTDIWQTFEIAIPMSGLKPGSVLEFIWEGVQTKGDRIELRGIKLEKDASASAKLLVTEPAGRIIDLRGSGAPENGNPGQSVGGRMLFLKSQEGGRWRISVDGRKELASGQIVGSEARWRCSAEDLAPGVNVLVLEVVGADGKAYAPVREIVRKEDAACGLYHIGNNRLYHKGRPYLPLAIYHAGPWNIDAANEISRRIGGREIDYAAAYKDIAAHGIDIIHTCCKRDFSNLEEIASLASAAGLKVIAEGTGINNAPMPDNLVGWYGVDEAASLEAQKRGREKLSETRAKDRLLPVYAANYGIDALDASAANGAFFDVLLFDHYVIRSRDTDFSELSRELKMIGERIRKSPSQVFGYVPQAFVYNGPEPTPEQLRLQVYLAVLHGARAIAYYSYNEDYGNADPGFTERKNEFPQIPSGMSLNPKRRHWWIAESALWNEVGRVNRELRMLEPYIFSDEHIPVSCDSKDVAVDSRRCSLGQITIAANLKPYEVSAMVNGVRRNFAPYQVMKLRNAESVKTGDDKSLSRTRAAWMSGKYGLMVHWLGPEFDGSPETIDGSVDAFDLEGFMEDFDASGAQWLIFPIGQNRGTYASPNSEIEKLCGPGHCSKRDLIKELATEVHKRGKRFIAYLPCETRMNTTVMEASGWIPGDPWQRKFQETWTKVIAEWSRQYGRLCDGWWFDGSYSSIWPNGIDVPLWRKATRCGNPDAIYSFNDGIIPQFDSDYTAGEIAWIKEGKIEIQEWAFDRVDKLTSERIVCDKEKLPRWMPRTPCAPGGTCLYHVLLPIDGFWGMYNPWPWCWIGNFAPELVKDNYELTDRMWMDERRRRNEFVPALYNEASLLPFMRDFMAAGGAVTINVGVTDGGRMNPASISLLGRAGGRKGEYMPRLGRLPRRPRKGMLGNAGRIVIIGDGITEIGQCSRGGYYHEVTNALRAVYGETAPEVYCAGYSGQTVGSWIDMIGLSRTQNVFSSGRDMYGKVRNVRTALGEETDLAVIFLGMNDILSPTVSADRSSWRKWKSDVKRLVDSVRARVGNAEIALGTITPLTTELTGPKNIVRDELNSLLRQLAVEEGYYVVPFGEVIEDLVRVEREIRADANPVPDFVHPRIEDGHLALAKCLLSSLGEDEAAEIPQRKLDGYLQKMKNAASGLSWNLDASRARRFCENVLAYEINWRLSPDKFPGAGTPDVDMIIEAPQKWDNIHPRRQSGAVYGTFCLWIAPDRLNDSVRITATNRVTGATLSETVTIPMPWCVSGGFDSGDQWKFDPRTKSYAWTGSNMVFASESELAHGKGFDKLLAERGVLKDWRQITPTRDYVGIDNPFSLDTYAYEFGDTHNTWYAARWIKSPDERRVRLCCGHNSFSDTLGLRVWFNGKAEIVDTLDRHGKERTVEAVVKMKAGWNLLFVRADHHYWQRQFYVSIMPVDGESLDDLLYSSRPELGCVVEKNAGRGIVR